MPRTLAYPRRSHPRRNYPTAHALLSNEQKAALCILAKEAWEKNGQDGPDGLKEWRRAQQLAAVGKGSLTECTQADYLPLRAHFLNLKGEPGKAVNVLVKNTDTDKRLAMFKLTEACREADVDLAYAGSICRTQYRCALEEANSKQIWRLVFTVRSRAAAKRRKVDEDNEPF